MDLNEWAVPKEGDQPDYTILAANELIHGIDASNPITTQRLTELAIDMNLISADTLHDLPSEFEKRKLILLFANFFGNRIEYCKVKRDHEPIVTRIEMLMPCGLHNNIRIPANLLTNLRKVIDRRTDIRALQKKLLGEKLEQTISESIGSGTCADFKYTYSDSMIKVVSLSGVKLV
jgi:hypothetical protein